MTANNHTHEHLQIASLTSLLVQPHASPVWNATVLSVLDKDIELSLGSLLMIDVLFKDTYLRSVGLRKSFLPETYHCQITCIFHIECFHLLLFVRQGRCCCLTSTELKIQFRFTWKNNNRNLSIKSILKCASSYLRYLILCCAIIDWNTSSFECLSVNNSTMVFT